jgi:hypothetical protein
MARSRSRKSKSRSRSRSTKVCKSRSHPRRGYTIKSGPAKGSRVKATCVRNKSRSKSHSRSRSPARRSRSPSRAGSRKRRAQTISRAKRTLAAYQALQQMRSGVVVAAPSRSTPYAIIAPNQETRLVLATPKQNALMAFQQGQGLSEDECRTVYGGIKRPYTNNQVTEMFRTLSLKYHPDRNPSGAEYYTTKVIPCKDILISKAKPVMGLLDEKIEVQNPLADAAFRI